MTNNCPINCGNLNCDHEKQLADSTKDLEPDCLTVNKHDINIYHQAVAKWGITLQYDLLVEECAELIKAILKFKRNPVIVTSDAICEECADVLIMINQIKYGVNLNKRIDQLFMEKMKRLEQRLKM